MKCFPSGGLVYDRPIPQEVVELKAYRDYLDVPPFLHSFYAGLLNKIGTGDLYYKEDFLETGNDLVVTIPMLEKAKWHAYYVSNPFVFCDVQLDHGRSYISADQQDGYDIYIRAISRHSPLNNLF